VHVDLRLGAVVLRAGSLVIRKPRNYENEIRRESISRQIRGSSRDGYRVIALSAFLISKRRRRRKPRRVGRPDVAHRSRHEVAGLIAPHREAARGECGRIHGLAERDLYEAAILQLGITQRRRRNIYDRRLRRIRIWDCCECGGELRCHWITGGILHTGCNSQSVGRSE